MDLNLVLHSLMDESFKTNVQVRTSVHYLGLRGMHTHHALLDQQTI